VSLMEPAAVARVLAMVAVAEQRQIDDVDVSFWLATLAVHSVTEDEFRSAVIRYYSDSTYPIRPGNVWSIVASDRQRQETDRRIQETHERQAQREAMDEAASTGDWAQFEARWPGVREKEVRRNVQWWMNEARRRFMPVEVREQAEMLGIEIPE
jgi:hypothetical protein